MNKHEQGSGVRDQGSESMERLLRQALPRVENDPEPARDLWPGMLRRLDERPAAVPWYDWALAGGLAVLTVIFPASVPVLLYYM
jgi:hypothetical protein